MDGFRNTLKGTFKKGLHDEENKIHLRIFVWSCFISIGRKNDLFWGYKRI
jgi:hypothetical protein